MPVIRGMRWSTRNSAIAVAAQRSARGRPRAPRAAEPAADDAVVVAVARAQVALDRAQDRRRRRRRRGLPAWRACRECTGEIVTLRACWPPADAPDRQRPAGPGRIVPMGDPGPRWTDRVDRSPGRAPDADERVDLGSALVTPRDLSTATPIPSSPATAPTRPAARLEGAPYTGGGILRTVAATRAADDATLEALCESRLLAALAAGTTTIECKSGYGLSLEEELRHLRIIRRVADRLPVRVVARSSARTRSPRERPPRSMRSASRTR